MERRVLSACGTQVHYLVGGAGPPLLLIHGVGESNNCWSANYDALARHFRIYAPDLAGWGETAPSSHQPHNLDGLADFIHGFLDALGLRCASILGWSLGGAAAIAAATRTPERFRKVMLVAPAGLGAEVHWMLRLAELPLLGELLLMPTMLTMRFLYRWLYSTRGRTVTRAFLQRALAKAKHPWHRATTLGFVRTGHSLLRGQRELDLRSRLWLLSMPVRVIWGRKDRILPVQHGERLQSLVPHSSMVVFEDCGHLPMVEDRERFDREVIAFFGSGKNSSPPRRPC
jgi:pimeloyl-ACP methyl ester carboxylesterase